MANLEHNHDNAIPVVPCAVAEEDATALFDLPDGVDPFHAI
jgi:hypothetical protein